MGEWACFELRRRAHQPRQSRLAGLVGCSQQGSARLQRSRDQKRLGHMQRRVKRLPNERTLQAAF